MQPGVTNRGNRNESTTMTDDLASRINPFKVAGQGYFVNQFLPIPLPFRMKHPPPDGTPNEIIITSQLVKKWSSKRRNIGTIVPDGVVVIDVDGIQGQNTLSKLEKSHGVLPKTWSTFRGDPERYHLWFQTPQGMVWPGKLGDKVDIIYRHYRYVVLPPSIHPDGEMYAWITPDDYYAEFGEFPSIDELPELPENWLELADRTEYKKRQRSHIDARMWIKEFGKGSICAQIQRTLTRHQKLIRRHNLAGGMHDAMQDGVWAIVGDVSSGHLGGKAALTLLRQTFLEQADDSARRKAGEAEKEWSRACVGAIEKTAIEPVQIGDPCIVEESEKELDPARFFGEGGIQARKLARAVQKTGKLAIGHDGRIYKWSEGFWQPDWLVGTPPIPHEVNRRTYALLQDRYRPGHTKLVMSVIATNTPKFPDDSQDKQYINLRNGLLDWETGELVPHNHNVDNIHRIPHDWRENAQCPLINEWLSEVLGDDAVQFAYEIMGYCLYNDNPLHKAVLLYGSGRNGKSTFIKIARQLIGRNNISTVSPQAFGDDKFQAAELYGKLANLAGDVDSRVFASTETFKQITGDDYVNAQRKYGQPFSFKNRATLIAAYNTLPSTKDTTEGFFSKWLVIPFTKYFPYKKADISIIDRLTVKSEMEGLLVRAVGGLQTIMRTSKFSEPQSVRKATSAFRLQADPVRGFVKDCLERIVDIKQFVLRSEVYTEYVAWSARNGYIPLSQARFLDRLRAAHLDVFKSPLTERMSSGQRGFKLLKLRESR